ncbi:MAG TPA: hypothetical protein VLB83_03595 [Candidatus Paceibacterota bacterium]|nr:hypothetical protein [Candidatus Paceibacterota bacterium]
MNIRYIAILAWFLALPSLAAGNASPRCAPDFSRAVEAYVAAELGPRLEAQIAAMNEPLCEVREDMANLVIIAGAASAVPLYSIVHMHIAKDGALVHAAKFNSNDPWKIDVPEEAWRREWCAMLRTVYPRDFIDQCADRFQGE